MQWDIQALKVLKDRKEVKVNMDLKGHRVSGVVRAQLAQEVSQDLQALELKVTEAVMAILGFLGLWDLSAPLDRKVHREFPGFLGHQVSQVIKVSAESKDFLGLKVTGGFLDSRDLKVNLVTKVPEVCKVKLVYQVWPGQLEKKAPKDQWDSLDKMVQRDQEVTKDPLGPLDSEVQLDLLGMLDLQEHLGFRDHQGFQEIQDNLVPKVTLVNQDGSSMQLAPLLLAFQDRLGLLVLLVLLGLQDYQVPLALLVCLAQLVLKVTGDIRETRENQE